MSDTHDPDRLSELVALLCDELINDEQFAELDEILRENRSARNWYRVYLSMHRKLDDHSLSQAQFGTTTGVTQTPERSLLNPLLAVAASIGLLIGVYAVYQRRQSAAPDSIIASVTNLENVIWFSDTARLGLGEPVSAGRFRLASGTLRLSYRHGVVLSLIGPADFEIQSVHHAVLHTGQLAAYVPDGAEGFRVDTPSAGVVDLGTEFGVTVDASGETELSVFDGEVELTPSTPNAETRIVSSGHAMKVDRDGNTKPFQLAPYKEARDSLRGWQLVWEPFGPGSATGTFPGDAGAGWTSPWSIDTENGDLDDKLSGILIDRPMHPGAEYYLTVGARPRDAGSVLSAVAVRSFGPIDQFTTDKPYTIELLLRTESTIDSIRRLSIYSHPADSRNKNSRAWEISARRARSDAPLSWSLAGHEGKADETRTLQVQSWKRIRCFVEIDPTRGVWRATIANFQQSISNRIDDAIPLHGSADGEMTLAIEAVGNAGKPVRFSIDGIRIQNHPGE